MRIGTNIPAVAELTATGFSVRRYAEMIRRADEYGFARIAAGDSQLERLECVASVTYIATLTKRAGIGPQVTNPVTRDVGVMANLLATIDAISGGRVYLVLGRGDGGVLNAGLPPATVKALKLYFVALRELLETGESTYLGRTVRLPWASRWAHKIPLNICAEGPRMLKLAGAIADGVYIGTGLTAEIVRDSLEIVHSGAREAGRDPSSVEVWWGTRTSIAPTRAQALADAKESLASAGNHALRGGSWWKHVPPELAPSLREYHQRFDYSQKGRGTQNAPLMEQLGLTDYFLQRFGVVGTPDEVVQRLQELKSFGVENINLGAHNPEALDLIGREVIPRLGD